MVQPLDFTLGIVIGIVVTFLANYLTEELRERKRHVRVAKAFIKELTMIRDDIKYHTRYKAVTMGTPVFSKLITELPLLKEGTAEHLLNTYSDIKFCLSPNSNASAKDFKELIDAIELSIIFLRGEAGYKSERPSKRYSSHDN